MEDYFPSIQLENSQDFHLRDHGKIEGKKYFRES